MVSTVHGSGFYWACLTTWKLVNKSLLHFNLLLLLFNQKFTLKSRHNPPKKEYSSQQIWGQNFSVAGTNLLQGKLLSTNISVYTKHNFNLYCLCLKKKMFEYSMKNFIRSVPFCEKQNLIWIFVMGICNTLLTWTLSNYVERIRRAELMV